MLNEWEHKSSSEMCAAESKDYSTSKKVYYPYELLTFGLKSWA